MLSELLMQDEWDQYQNQARWKDSRLIINSPKEYIDWYSNKFGSPISKWLYENFEDYRFYTDKIYFDSKFYKDAKWKKTGVGILWTCCFCREEDYLVRHHWYENGVYKYTLACRSCNAYLSRARIQFFFASVISERSVRSAKDAEDYFLELSNQEKFEYPPFGLQKLLIQSRWRIVKVDMSGFPILSKEKERELSWGVYNKVGKVLLSKLDPSLLDVGYWKGEKEKIPLKAPDEINETDPGFCNWRIEWEFFERLIEDSLIKLQELEEEREKVEELHPKLSELELRYEREIGLWRQQDSELDKRINQLKTRIRKERKRLEKESQDSISLFSGIGSLELELSKLKIDRKQVNSKILEIFGRGRYSGLEEESKRYSKEINRLKVKRFIEEADAIGFKVWIEPRTKYSKYGVFKWERKLGDE